MSLIPYDNIFDAITNSFEKSSELQIRSDLMIAIRDIIDDHFLTPKDAIKKLGLTQSHIRSIQTGKIEKLSIDLLVTCLFRLGFRLKPFYRNHKLTIDVQPVATK